MGWEIRLTLFFLLYFEKNISIFQPAFPCQAVAPGPARWVLGGQKPPPAVAPGGCPWPQRCDGILILMPCFPLLLLALKLEALLQKARKSKNTLILNTASADKAIGAGSDAQSRVLVRATVLFPSPFLGCPQHPSPICLCLGKALGKEMLAWGRVVQT